MSEGSEAKRIELIVERDGLEAAIAWVRQTLQTYRQAVEDPGNFASTAQYGPLFQKSIAEFEAWLAQHGEIK